MFAANLLTTSLRPLSVTIAPGTTFAAFFAGLGRTSAAGLTSAFRQAISPIRPSGQMGEILLLFAALEIFDRLFGTKLTLFSQNISKWVNSCLTC